VLTLSAIVKDYPAAEGPLRALDGVNLSLAAGESAVVVGPSGAGKSTLLHIAGGLEAPTAGSVDLDGTNPYGLSATGLARYRNRDVGFVFRHHCLLPQLTVLENTLVPTLVGDPDADAADRARVLLTAVGLEPRAHLRPAHLTVGERQRAAIARALVRSPRLLLCDEPTGNLDRDAADRVAEILTRLHVQQHTALLLVTDSAALATRFERRLTLTGGRLEGD